MNENLNFEFVEELFEEKEFNRLVSFSKNLGESYTPGIHFKTDSFPQMFGEYKLIRLLGHGKICTAYLAQHVDSHEQFVLRKIAPNHVKQVGDFEFARQFEKFRHETGGVRAVDASNVATVYDMGTVDEVYFYATRFVQGKNLAKFANANFLSNRQAAITVKSIAEATHRLHQAGIFHCNLKTANVILSEGEQRPWLLEPESALLRSFASNDAEAAAFQAPEVLNDLNNIDAVAEVWSLGAILYNCLLGEPLAISGPVGSPRKRNPKIAKDLETICLKCLRKDRSQRYVNAAELASDLELFLDYQPIKASPVGFMAKLMNRVSRRG